MSSPVDVAVNPLDANQRYVLWGNGRIDNFNTPPITEGPDWTNRPDQPIAVALHIIDYAEGTGYVLDKQGGVHALNGASVLTLGGDGDNEVVGIPYWPTGIYVDWSWDPYHAGRGVALDGYGTLHPFGGAPAPFRSLNRWDVLVARKLKMSWAPDMRAITMDYSGGLHADYSAVLPGGSRPYWPGQDIARDFEITDWATGSGFLLDLFGGMHTLGNTAYPAGFPYRPGSDVARVLKVLSPSNPTRLMQVWVLGQEFEWTASTPPTVVAGGFDPKSPASSVTTTTRPTLSWAYTDAQGDSQKGYEVAVFTEAFAAANDMSNPWAHLWSSVVFEEGIDAARRGLQSPKDLPNGAYRMYVRVKDTADQWSAWASRSWTQNVPAPATPTGLTASVNHGALAVDLSVKATTGGSANMIRFECSDDDGLTWKGVRGAERVPLQATTTAVDYDIPFNVKRLYSARAFNDNPRVISAPSNEVFGVLILTSFGLTSVENPSLGGRVFVQDPIGWTQPTTSGIFEGIGAKYPTVVSDGVPKARRFSIRLVSIQEETWRRIDALLQSNSTLVFRDPLGDVIYCRVSGDLSVSKPKGSTTEFQHDIEFPVVEIAPPIESV